MAVAKVMNVVLRVVVAAGKTSARDRLLELEIAGAIREQ